MPRIERLLQAEPWGKGLKQWIARNPSFHTDRIRTPLRLEFYSKEGVYYWWDIYTLLRRQKKPVEAIVVADGEHNLVKPGERFIIQQGNVDWALYWLKGQKNNTAANNRQYQRWDKLREQQSYSRLEAMEARKAKPYR